MKKIYSLLCLGLFAVSAMAETPSEISSSWGPVAPQVSTAENPVWYMMVASHLSSTGQTNRFMSYNGSELVTNYGADKSVYDGNDHYAFRLEAVGDGNATHVYLVSKVNGYRLYHNNVTPAGDDHNGLSMTEAGNGWALMLGSETGTSQASSCVDKQYVLDYYGYTYPSGWGNDRHAFINADNAGSQSNSGVITLYYAGIHQASGWFFIPWTGPATPTVNKVTDLAGIYSTNRNTLTLSWTAPTQYTDNTAISGTITYKVTLNGTELGTTTSTTYTIDNIASRGGDALKLSVQAYCENESTISDAETTTIPFPVSPVTDFAGTYNDNAVSLSWTAPTTRVNDSAITGNIQYIIKRGDVELSKYVTGTTYTDSSITDDMLGTTVTYSIEAYENYQQGASSVPETTDVELPAATTVEGETFDTTKELLPAAGMWNVTGGSWINAGTTGAIYSSVTNTNVGTAYYKTPLILTAGNYNFTGTITFGSGSNYSSTVNIYVVADPTSLNTPVATITANTKPYAFTTDNFTIAADGSYYIVVEGVNFSHYTTFSELDLFAVNEETGGFETVGTAVYDMNDPREEWTAQSTSSTGWYWRRYSNELQAYLTGTFVYADNWFILNEPVTLSEANQYDIVFDILFGESNMEVYLATEGTSAAMASGTKVCDFSISGKATYRSNKFRVSENGSYYLGIRVTSLTENTWINDIIVNQYAPLGTSISNVKAAGKVYSYGDELVLPADVTSVMVFDLQGRRVLGSKAADRISLQGLASGVYVVKAQTANGTVTTKIVK